MNTIIKGFKWGFGFSIAGAIVSWLWYKITIRTLFPETKTEEDEPVKKGYTKLAFNSDEEE